METTALRQTQTGTPRVGLARRAFDPTQLFAQRDRLPWFWFFVAVAVSLAGALDRYHIINQFKQRERVVIIDPAQTYYVRLTGIASGSSRTRAVAVNRSTGVGWLRSATTSCSRSTQRPSQTMQPSSGLVRAPIQTRRSGWQE